MSDFIKQVYLCPDGTTYDDLESAWNHTHRINLPNIQMFDCFGNRVQDVRVASDFIVGGALEAEFVDDYLRESEDSIVYAIERAVPGSWITCAETSDDYILYPPEDYKDEDHNANWEIHDRLREGCDLWRELLGR